MAALPMSESVYNIVLSMTAATSVVLYNQMAFFNTNIL